MEWLRWYHGAVSDDKWPLIARKSGQTVAVVIAVWAALLECASSSEVRGDVHDFDPESMDALMQLPDGATQAVVTALSEGKRPRIIDGMIANWSKRQPVREREDGNTSAERVRAHRERQKALQNKETSDGNASVTPCNADETPVQHHETPRTEKRREEKNIRQESYDSSPEQSAIAAGEASCSPLPVAITLPLNTGDEHPVTQGEVEIWKDLYPAVDVMQALRNMHGWLLGNPKKRKTKHGIGRFIQSWLAKEQDNPRASPTQAQARLGPSRNGNVFPDGRDRDYGQSDFGALGGRP